MNKVQKGFTLIELVVVITILGILAAFAFPRFAALEVEARIAATESLGGSLRAASALAHSMSLVQGSPATIDMEGVTITLADGYPAALAGGITAAMQDLTGFGTPVYGAAPDIATYDTEGGTAGTCTVVFAEPLAAGDAPIVTITTTGC